MIGMNAIENNIRLKVNSPSQGLAGGVFLSMLWKVKRVLINVLQLLKNRSYDFFCPIRGFMRVQPFLNIPKIEFKLVGYAIRMPVHLFTSDAFRFSNPAKKSSFERVIDSMDWFNRQARYSDETGKPSAAKLMRWKLPLSSKTVESLAKTFISAWVSKNFRNACSLAALVRVTVYELMAGKLENKNNQKIQEIRSEIKNSSLHKDRRL